MTGTGTCAVLERLLELEEGHEGWRRLAQNVRQPRRALGPEAPAELDDAPLALHAAFQFHAYLFPIPTHIREYLPTHGKTPSASAYGIRLRARWQSGWRWRRGLGDHLDCCGAGQQGRQHRPDAVTQVLVLAAGRTRTRPDGARMRERRAGSTFRACSALSEKAPQRLGCTHSLALHFQRRRLIAG